jgi:MinD-like ATPase involved in chromosome partitioning or flagellar assembly
MSRFISIVSRGRGTGKTTVALNLGLALHKLKQKTLVFDADFSKPNVLDHLNINHLPITLEDVFSGNNHIFDSIYTHTSGLKIIPSMTMNDYSKLQYHMKDLLADYDYVIVDTPNDLEDVEEVLKTSNEAIIVHTPDYSSKHILDAAKTITKNKVVNLGIVLNKSHPESVNKIFGIPVMTKIPDHAHIRNSYTMRHPVMHAYPSSPVCTDFTLLAKKLIV